MSASTFIAVCAVAALWWLTIRVAYRCGQEDVALACRLAGLERDRRVCDEAEVQP